MVESLSYQLGMIPLRSSFNVFVVLRQVEMGKSPEIDELAEFSSIIDEITDLYNFFTDNEDKLMLFTDLKNAMVLPKPFTSAFFEAFDEEDQLNGNKYPVLGKLRRDASNLRGKIIQTMQNLLRSTEMRDKIADRYIKNIFVIYDC